MAPEDLVLLHEALSSYLPKLKAPKVNIAWSELKNIPKDKRKEFREKHQPQVDNLDANAGYVTIHCTIVSFYMIPLQKTHRIRRKRSNKTTRNKHSNFCTYSKRRKPTANGKTRRRHVSVAKRAFTRSTRAASCIKKMHGH